MIHLPLKLPSRISVSQVLFLFFSSSPSSSSFHLSSVAQRCCFLHCDKGLASPSEELGRSFGSRTESEFDDTDGKIEGGKKRSMYKIRSG